MLQKWGHSCFDISHGDGVCLLPFPSCSFHVTQALRTRTSLLLPTSSCVSWGRAVWAEPGCTPPTCCLRDSTSRDRPIAKQ